MRLSAPNGQTLTSLSPGSAEFSPRIGPTGRLNTGLLDVKTQQETHSAPAPGAVLVIQRWNSWARVLDPETNETQWVFLGEADFEPVVAQG